VVLAAELNIQKSERHFGYFGLDLLMQAYEILSTKKQEKNLLKFITKKQTKINKKGRKTMNKLKWLDEKCHVCDQRLNSWDNRCSNALKYKNSVCEKCICKEYDQDISDFRARMNHFFGLIPCMGI